MTYTRYISWLILVLAPIVANANDANTTAGKVDTLTPRKSATKPAADMTSASIPVEASDPDEVLELLNEIKAAAGNVNDYTMTMFKHERFGDKMGPEVLVQVKWARPFKVYLKYLNEADKGQEVLFVKGRNDDELLAHQGSFPDITISLDPCGSTCMSENHHPIVKGSLFDFISGIENNIRQAIKRNEGEIRLKSETLWGRSCTKLEVFHVKGGWYHAMADGETLWEVAERYDRNMYQILHHNPGQGWDEADDPGKGDQVFIPRYYSSRMFVWIDNELNMPLKAITYDHFGQLYEVFENRNLQVNVGLTEKDFDPDNPEYDF
jgi:uncharacterized protein DUF1571